MSSFPRISLVFRFKKKNAYKIDKNNDFPWKLSNSVGSTEKGPKNRPRAKFPMNLGPQMAKIRVNDRKGLISNIQLYRNPP